MSSTGTEEYYQRRAREHDEVYIKPERQDDLGVLRRAVARLLVGKRVLEVAAGTGWWTEVLADTAAGVVATDVNSSTLQVAIERRSWPATTRFVAADAFNLDTVGGHFDAAFVGFFWSHVPLVRLDQFLDCLTCRLEPGALVVVADNRFVAGSNHPISRRDEDGNSYQQRRLSDGSTWEVLKNFPTPEAVEHRLRRFVDDLDVKELDYYWIATGHTRGAGAKPSGPHDLDIPTRRRAPLHWIHASADRRSWRAALAGSDNRDVLRADYDEALHRSETREAYERLAEVWSDTTDDGPYNGGLERPALRGLVPQPLAGTKVLDVGCGSGAQCEWLLDQGAGVVGVDLSPRMVDQAARRCGGRAQLLVADLGEPLTLEPASFDGITCSLMLHYLADWTVPLRSFASCLRPGGWAVISLDHPAAPPLPSQRGGYFDTELVSDRWRKAQVEVTQRFWRRPLGAIIDAFRDAGFVIDRVAEARPSPDALRRWPDDLALAAVAPSFIIFRLLLVG